MKSFSTFFLTLIFVFAISDFVFSQQPDTSFGTNGVVNIFIPPISAEPFGHNQEGLKSFYLPQEQKILALGNAYAGAKGPVRRLILTRRKRDGMPDETFGQNGISLSASMVSFDAIQQPDGKIMVAGYGINGISPFITYSWRIIRITADGNFDPTFDSDGILVKAFNPSSDIATNIALQNDGKIIVSGTSALSTGVTLTVVARFNTNGTEDLSFGPYGKGFIDFYDNRSLSKKMDIQPDGKIILSGSTTDYSSTSDIIVLRLTEDGILDTTFGNGGAVFVDFGRNEYLSDMKVRGNGKIIVSGNSSIGNSTNYEATQILAQLEQNGNFDQSFGENGFVKNDTSLRYDLTEAMTLRENGNIITAGTSEYPYPRIDFNNTIRYGLMNITEYDLNGKVVGRNFTRHTEQNQIISGLSAFGYPVRDVLATPDGKISLNGLRQYASGMLMVLFKFSSISSVFNANTFFDFDFNGRDDVSLVRREANGKLKWFSSPSFEKEFGEVGDILAPGDYNGDLATDLAVFRPSTGEWFNSRVNYGVCPQEPCFDKIRWGLQGDIPASGDFDGDGKTDRTVFRPSEGVWYILNSSGNYTIVQFGLNGDLPVTGDYDGDGKSDLAVIRNENGKIVWYIYQSSTNNYVIIQFGLATDKAVIGDYNGDRKTDIAVWRPETGDWYVLSNYSTVSIKNHGANGDIPTPADYDNDKITDLAVFAPSSASHRIILSANQQSINIQFGFPTDFPPVSAYVRGF